ncbi:MAG: NAD(P)-dependent oxidoreductase [Chloroflexota bacterium]|jgi:predicted homoserine dehydrogenase-like protein
MVKIKSNFYDSLPVCRVGIVGTGFIASGLLKSLDRTPEFNVTKMLTRRDLHNISDHPRSEILTDDVDELIDSCDLVVECSGNVIHATAVIDKLLAHDMPVVTLDAEFHVTTGSYFVGKGNLTEAEGDQPGSLAALHENVVGMGFRPIVYGNVKAYLNHNPTVEDMVFWANRNGISLEQVTAFTDGTKVQIEQVLVANGLGANIATTGLLGPHSETITEGAMILAKFAQNSSGVISDYIVSRDWSGGVFIVAEHDPEQVDYLRYYKMGDGPAYLIPQSYHLCHLEVPKTMRRVMNCGKKLLDNSAIPQFSVATIAKRLLLPGELIPRGMGSFAVRGEAVRIDEHPNHLPIGLLFNGVIRNPVEPGQVLTFDDIDLPESLAIDAWNVIRRRSLPETPLEGNRANGADLSMTKVNSFMPL